MALDVDALLAAETRRIVAWSKLRNVESIQKHIPKLAPEEFVKRCYAAHEDLVKSWNGWNFHGELGEIEPERNALRPLCQQLYEVFSVDFTRAASTPNSGVHPDDSLYFGIELSSYGGVQRYGDTVISKTVDLSGVNVGNRQPLLLVGFKRVELTEEQRRAKAADTGWALNEIATWEHIRVQTPVRHGERVSAATFRALEEHGAQSWRPLFERWFQTLGERVWNAGKLQVAMSLSCSPLAFLRLGHYGEKSCFANGKQHAGSKYWLATDTPGSFVVVAYKPRSKDAKLLVSESTGNRVGKVAGRAWGMLIQPAQGVMVTNFYLLGFDQLAPQIKKLCEQAFGMEKLAPLAWARSDSTAAQAWRRIRDMLVQRALYLNPDTALLTPGGTTPNFARVQDYLEYSTLFGLHTNSGHGPDRSLLRYAGPGIKPPEFAWNIDLIADARKWADTVGWDKLFERPVGRE